MHYRLRRYLTGASDSVLAARLSDIAANIYTFTGDGKVGLVEAGARDVWAALLAHLNFECESRGRDPLDLDGIRELTFTQQNLLKFRRQPHILERMKENAVFCRYGERKWIKDMQDSGSILLRAASYYSDNSLDPARRDDELNYTAYVCPHDYDLGLVDPRIARLVPQRSFGEIVHRKPSDHYLYSVTAGFHISLYADFFVDACLVIKDQAEFERRLVAGVAKVLPGWRIDFREAWYGDPFAQSLILPNRDTEIFFLKHIRYMYQREFRLVALPPKELERPLPDLPVFVGSLHDITELVPLEGHPFARQ